MMTGVYIVIGIYAFAMLLIFLYSLAQGQLLYHFLQKRNYSPVQEKDKAYNWPVVTVQLPIFNEQYVVERLIEAVATLNYPADKLEIQLLDDSSDETSDIIRRKIEEYPNSDMVQIQRINRIGYKAGALREGLKIAKGEFIAIFDADFVPDSDFLKKTVPYFENEEIGMVQTRWTHLNQKYSVLTQLQAFALDAHFLVEQVGRNIQNAFINFNGTAGIWRKACILDAGNWEDDTLTEDLDLSYRAQKAGWKFQYLPDVECPAELPPVMSALKAQQFRWTKGGAECARKHLLSVLNANFPIKTKLHATAHLLNSSIFIAILTVSLLSVPIWLAAFHNMLPEWMWQYGYIFMVGFIVISGVYFVANTYKLPWKEKILKFIWQLPLFLAVSMGLALHNSIAVWEGLNGKKSPFIRTPKFNLLKNKKDWKSNRYLNFNLPFSTYVEGGLALMFAILVFYSIKADLFILFPFHILLALGYGVVFFTSCQSYVRKG